jgi:hypothetical protein
VPVRERVDSIWELVAFCGRYGHQSIGDLLAMPLAELSQFSRALQRLIEREADPLHERMMAGG